jgi:hypothetical protein
VPIYYTILPSQTCFVPAGAYQTFLSIWHLIIWSWLPSIGMLIFGLLTIAHIRKGKNRVVPQNMQNNSQQNQKKTDRQLIQMMLAQSFTLGLTTTSYSVVNLCVALVPNPGSDPLTTAINNLLSNVFAYIALTGPCVSFYLFTLSSKLFRNELMRLLLRR